MKTTIHPTRLMKRAVAFVLCLITFFSVLTFADGTVFQFAITASAAAETERVIIMPTYSFEFDETLYKSLLKQLNAQLKKKNFSKLVKTFLREILYYEVQNYPQWKNVYPDLPSTATLIKDNLINVIPLIQKIKLIDFDTEEGKILAERTGWDGLTSPVKNGYSIRSFYWSSSLDPQTGRHFNYLHGLQNLAHEIRHARDMEGLSKQKFPTYFMDMVISDGATTFHERFVSPMCTEQYGADMIFTEKGAYVQFPDEWSTVYSYYHSFYNGLVYLAGYSTVNAVGKGKSINTIKKAIAKKYGQDTANSIWKILNALPDDATNDENEDFWLTSNKAVNLTTKFFQILLQCIKKDIQKLDISKPKTIRKYMDIYRNIKLKVLPEIYNKKKKNVNEKYFNTKELDSLLAEKVIASKALPTIYDNPNLNRQAIIEMLYCDEVPYESSEDYPCFLPATIAQTTYYFSMEDGNPMVLELFADEYEVMVAFICKFNEKGSISRSGDYMYFA